MMEISIIIRNLNLIFNKSTIKYILFNNQCKITHYYKAFNANYL